MDLFRWACLLVASAALGYLCWAVEDLRREAKAATEVVNQHLPKILARVEGSSATLAALSDDIKQMRELAGASGPRDQSLTLYANRLLETIERAPVQVGVEKLLGKGLKDPLPAAEWARDGRKEALWLAFRARSKRELLERLSKNKFGSDWLVLAEGAEPEPMASWLAARDPETKALLAAPAQASSD
ncbi:MAG: hypothetical protein AB7N76_34160 [Planctomycetota bacterium]